MEPADKPESEIGKKKNQNDWRRMNIACVKWNQFIIFFFIFVQSFDRVFRLEIIDQKYHALIDKKNT